MLDKIEERTEVNWEEEREREEMIKITIEEIMRILRKLKNKKNNGKPSKATDQIVQ